MLKAAQGEVLLSRLSTGGSNWVLPRCLWQHPRSQLSAGDSDLPSGREAQALMQWSNTPW